ncbi:hypothetical protein GQ43DRAFT_197816 [Delitschia confertaspora ATCC 74209]|uniref:Uncharacterized protein n=1 Tax=Delitschia confertaspora ATCC 74209 TaxID=1513339 RepID=A0A9P4JR49_9PLEO|nr:hypothetical protein GQ43DRAFT_197816 [Delitschia confertaspora ATCC 74209]
MSIARAVTKRMKSRPDLSASTPTRSQSMKNPGHHIDRAKISSPVALISTTNMLSYNAPDIASHRHVLSKPSTLSQGSAEDSDNSASTQRSRSSSHSSRETLTDASSVESSPTSPAPNHLSGYFGGSTGKPPRRSVSSGNIKHDSTKHDSTTVETTQAAPAIPERALSHSKRAHERIARNRSLQNMRPPSALSGRRDSARSSRDQRTSVDIFKGLTDESHPFGKELEQLNEVAEEFGGAVRDAEMEADLTAMAEKGLAKFCATDYLQEITPLFGNRFGNPYQGAAMAWI